jgi:3-hydroxymyristoyl/3-hydroxydecanoyl-(acyl carrier protein) dehydratase/malonyl CoA-acyl carrier protein transacylase
MGRELLQHFPGLHDRVRDIISDVGRSLWEELLYPRSLTPLTEAERKERSARLSGNPIAMIESGISLSILYTLILREIFAVRPQAALGYSLGEISMLWANGVWQDGDAGSAAWRTSPLFKHRLFGPKDAVREHWGLEGGDDDFWASYILKARPDDVRACVADEPHAYLSIINTPREVVVAGEREACRRVIEASGARHPLPMPFDAVIHNEAMMSEYPEFVDLYTNKTDPDSELTYYSAFDYAPLTLTSSALARATARMTCSPVDFPRLVETAYADGARLFVELGPLSTCSRWVERILRGKPHAVVPIDKSRREGFAGVLAALAVLISHRVPLDLSPLVAAPERSFDPAVLAREPLPDAVPVTTPARGTSEPVGVGVEMEVGRAVAPSLAAVSGSDLYRDLQQHAARVAQGHLAFLETQRSVIRQTGTLLQLQIDASRRLLGGAEGDDSMSTVHVAPLYTRAQIVEFATGDPVACFGPAYAVYRGRRMPRLPNGALRLVDRVMAIEGERGEIRVGTRLRSEVDVPFDAWYLRENAYPTVPYAVLMEMALQPCGFLSSYMGSMLSHPEVEFYFRNLDGEGALLAEPDLRGKTVTNRVELLSSSKVRGIILQHYAFELSCEGRPFYRGHSSFGYFTPQALRKQQGLDGGRMTRPWYQEKRRNCLPVDARPFFRTGRRRRYERLASGKLRLIDRAQICPDGGEHRSGYVHADVNVRPDDWFFACHFYQDPVMPGSLGVGAVLQALQLFALEQGLGTHLKNPRFGPLVGPTANWKYRGQVTQEKNDVHLEAHVKEIDVRKDAVMLVADANVWENGLRIYELQDVGVRLLEA